MSPRKRAAPPADPQPGPDARRRLGQFLRGERRRAGLSRAQVEAALHAEGVVLGYDRLARLEGGATLPTLWEAEELATLYGCTPEDLPDQLRVAQWARPGVRVLQTAQAHREAWARAIAAGDGETALAHALSMEELARGPKLRCWARNNQAMALWRLGRLGPALRLLRRALREPAAADPELSVYLWHNLCVVNRYLGHRPLAAAAVAQAQAALARWLPPRGAAGKAARRGAEAMLLNGEANLLSDTYELATRAARSTQAWQRAEAAYAQARAIYGELGRAAEATTTTLNLGLLHALAERWEPAERELAQGLAQARDLRHPRLVALGLVHRGRAAAWRGNRVAAWEVLQEALPLVEGRADMADLCFLVCYHLERIARRRRQWAAVRRYKRDLERVAPAVRRPSRERERYAGRRARGDPDD